MSTLPKVRDLLEGHITLELDSIDRLCLNGYVPQLQHGPGLVGFLCQPTPWTINCLACAPGADHRKIRCLNMPYLKTLAPRSTGACWKSSGSGTTRRNGA